MTYATAPQVGRLAAHQSLDHIAALDGVRGAAVILVLVSHSAERGLLPSVLGNGLGQMGVTLFFGLSGFLMSYLYLSRPCDRVELRNYAVRRAARVLPLYYAALFLALLLLAVGGLAVYGVTELHDLWYSAALLKGKRVFWAIPVEIHFYIVFAGIWWATARGRFQLAILTLLCAQGLLAVGAHMALQVPSLLWLRDLLSGGTLAKWLHIFVFGVCLARYRVGLQAWTHRDQLNGPLTLLAWGVLVAGLLTPPELRRMAGVPVLPNFIDPITAGYPMILLTVVVAGLGPTAVFKAPFLRWFGRLSYGLYLLHLPVIALCLWMIRAQLLPQSLGFALAMGLSLLLAALSFRYFERPAQKRLQRNLIGK